MQGGRSLAPSLLSRFKDSETPVKDCERAEVL